MKNEVANYWSDLALAHVEFLSAKFINHAFPMHFHERYAISAMVTGQMGVIYQDAPYLIKSGAMTYMNPGDLHNGYPIDPNGWHYRVMYIELKMLEELVAGMKNDECTKTCPSPRPFRFHFNLKERNSNIYRRFIAFHEAIEFDFLGKQKIDDIEKQSRLIMLMGDILLENGDLQYPRLSQLTHFFVKRATDYIHQNFNKPFTLLDLSKYSGASPFHLTRCFKSQVGLAPHAYLNQLRIKNSKNLLKLDRSISEIALSLGFTDQSHFSHRFKKLTGTTPGIYRNDNRRAAKRL